MGAERRWIRSAGLWSAIGIVLLPVVVGVPVGMLAGARLFRVFAQAMGVIDRADYPLAISVAVSAAVVVITLVTAAAAIRRPSLRVPSRLLRPE